MKYFNWFKNKIKEHLSFGSEPDFFIVGAQKCGTTSLYYYIERYASNFTPPVDKELYFFSENYHKGLNYYRAKFPIFKFNKITGEATPDYIYYHRAPDLIKNDFPNSKIVIVLRDPAERAYSQYNHQNFTRKTIGYDPLSFSQAIREGRDRFNISPKSDFFHEYKYYSYIERGFYDVQIKRYFDVFGEDNVLILDVSEVNKLDVIKRVFDFIGLQLDSNLKNNIKEKHNTNEYEEMSPEDVIFLKGIYKESVLKLSKLIGRDLPWMNRYK